ncbi:50S ribosomal protein L25 [Bacteroidia bacterium]|nr:50S ribosomal protein L25 [Bacteroidia bacterium]
MQKLELKAVARDSFGKKASKAVRRNGQVPCIVYGGGETVHFAVGVKDLKPLIYSPNSYVVELDIDGKKEVAVMREAQFHPVREEILHIDFYRVIEGKPVTIDLPVALEGNSEGVKVGGKLILNKRKLTVSGLIEKLPDQLTVDITSLELGKSIFAGDLKFDGLTILTPATTAICAVKITRAAKAAAEAE